MVRLSIEERREQYTWAMNTLRLGQSGNRAALHAELLRQESEVIALLEPDDQDYFRRRQDEHLRSRDHSPFG